MLAAMKSTLAIVLAAGLAACGTVENTRSTTTTATESDHTMELGAFSVSLAVKDLTASRAFYEKLGFEPIHGDASQNWLILQNGTTTIGLFQGMFENNIMTFNPGWAADMNHPAEFTDIRDLQRTLEGRGLELTTRADESTTGPASLTLADPDGNVILLDQHR